MAEEKALIPSLSSAQSLAVMPVMAVTQAIERHKAMAEFVRSEIWHRGIDSDILPGTDRETLLLPGAQKLGFFFGLAPRFTFLNKIEDWTGEAYGGEPFFVYVCKCSLYRGEYLVAEAIGACVSWEARYRWRWVPAHEVPAGLALDRLKKREQKISEFAFAIERGESDGKYGKPPAYWQQFRDAIASGKAKKIQKQTKSGNKLDAWEIDVILYRVPNDDIYSQVNTLRKMAQKRAYVGAIITATNGSEFFTQDMEDFIEGTVDDAEMEITPSANVNQITEGRPPAMASPENERKVPEAERRKINALRNVLYGQIGNLQSKFALHIEPEVKDGKKLSVEDIIYERIKREVAKVEHLAQYTGDPQALVRALPAWFEAEKAKQVATAQPGAKGTNEMIQESN